MTICLRVVAALSAAANTWSKKPGAQRLKQSRLEQRAKLGRRGSCIASGVEYKPSLRYRRLMSGKIRNALSPLYHACMADDRALVKKLSKERIPTTAGVRILCPRSAALSPRVSRAAPRPRRRSFEPARNLHGNTPLYFLAGHRESDRNAATRDRRDAMAARARREPERDERHWKTKRAHVAPEADGGRRSPSCSWLMARSSRPPADGRSAYALSVRAGNSAMAEWLGRHGADTSGVTAIDGLLGACMRADEPKARAILSRNRRRPTLTKEDGGTISWRCTSGVRRACN